MDKKEKISLENMDRKLPFCVPENYFEDFGANLDARIEKRTPVRPMIKSWLYMAAMFIGIFFIANVFYTIYQNNSSKVEEAYENYLLSQVDNVSLLDFYFEDIEEY